LFDLNRISEIVEQHTVGSAFYRTDPYTDAAATELQQNLSELAREASSQLISIYPQTSLAVIARNTISSSNVHPFLTSALARILLESEIEGDNSIGAEIAEYIDHHFLGTDPALASVYKPDTSNIIGLPLTHKKALPGLKLRYFLAAQHPDATVAEILNFQYTIGGCSSKVVKREINNYLKRRPTPQKPLSLASFTKLKMPWQKALLEPELRHTFLISNRKADAYVAEFDKVYEEYLTLRRNLSSLPDPLRARDIESSNNLATRIHPGLINKALAKEFKPRLERALALPKRSGNNQWLPLSPDLAFVLKKVVGRNSMIDRLSTSRARWVQDLANKAQSLSALQPVDVERLFESMTRAEKRILIRAGFFDERLDLPRDLVENQILTIAKHSMDRRNPEHEFFWNHVGYGPVSKSIFDRLISSRSKALAACLKSGLRSTGWGYSSNAWTDTILKNIKLPIIQSILPRDLESLRILRTKLQNLQRNEGWIAIFSTSVSIGSELLKAELAKITASKTLFSETQRLRDICEELEHLIDLQPSFEQPLTESVSYKSLLGTIANLTNPPSLINRIFRGKAHFKNWQKDWKLVVAKERSIENTLADIQKFPVLVRYLDVAFASYLKYDNSPRAMLLKTLCYRNKASTLRGLLKAGLGSPAAVLMDAASILPDRSGTRAQLELMSILGLGELGVINQVLARMKRSADTACKLDHEYFKWTLPKKSGGTRLVSAPSRPLKRLQRALLHKVIEQLGEHEAAFGFVKDRSIKQNAARHVGQNVVVNCDIKNCFPSISWRLVLGCLRRDLGEHLSPATVSLLTDIICSRGALPIGAPTSPAILNRVLYATDQYLSEAASRRGATYSRYADDLTFSGESNVVSLIKVTESLLSRIGLELDPKKTNIYRRGRRQIVTGLTVNQKVSVPRRVRRQLRAAIHALENGQPHHWHGAVQSDSALLGRLNFLKDISPELAEPLLKRFKAVKHE